MPPSRGDGPHGGVIEDAYRKLGTLLRDIAERKFNVPPADAEALVNDVFATYLLRRDIVRNPEKWLVGAVCHASRAYWRRVRRVEPLPPDICNYPDPATSQEEERLISKLMLALALNNLPPRCRELLRMYYVEGYSTAELAEHLDTTRGYVAQMMHGCRCDLRRIIRELMKEKS